MIQTAKLTERLVLKEIAFSATTAGEVIEICRPIAVVYASIVNQRGDAGFKSNTGLVYTDNISFYMRYRNLDPKSTVIEYNGEDYGIDNITHVSRNATVIDCNKSK
jgi:head-tail adaptor